MRKNLIVCLAVAVLALSGCATTKQPGDQASGKTCPPVNQQQQIKAGIAEELEALGEPEVVSKKPAPDECDPNKVEYDIPITINAEVEQGIDLFQNKIPKRFRMWLERSGRYIPMMRSVLRQYGLPEDLVYLALIESGFNCNAYSTAAAVGPWQFIAGTGKRFGLRIDYWVDERRDPVKSTHAAAQYLGDLYAEFGSWYLAAAAYNAGEGKIRRALKKYNANNFWSISRPHRDYLKDETRQYVPRMIAAAIIAKSPEKFGFNDLKYWPPMQYDEVRVHPGTSLDVAAKLAGVNNAELKSLNPELRRWCTPPSGNYTLKIPFGARAQFEQGYAKLAPKDRQAHTGVAAVRVQRGDTLGRIAKTHNMRLSDLVALNPKVKPNSLRVGQKIIVSPGARGAVAYAEAEAPVVSSPRRASLSASSTVPPARQGTRKIVYKVKPGDSLWDIAQTYNLDWHDVRRWNGQRSSKIQAGDSLVLYVPQSKAEAKLATAKAQSRTYVVRRGDNLWEIAQAHGVSTADIKRWNNMRGNNLAVGDRLTIHKSSPAKVATGSGQVVVASAERSGADDSSAGPEKTYRVRKGDTLSSIGRRFNVSADKLRRLNSLRGDNIRVGDTLRVQ